MTGRSVVTTGSTADMWQRLFQPNGWWGWEHVAPAPLTASPEVNQPPVAEQVYAPHDFQFRERQSRRAWLGLVGYLALTFVAVVLSGTMVQAVAARVPGAAEWVASIVLALGVAFAVWNFVRTRRRFTVLKRDYTAHYSGASQQYNDAYAAWHQRVTEHDRREQERVSGAKLWYPVRLTSRPSRVDVFGGTEDGWASLLGTFGAGQLAAGASIMLLDFTDMAVGDNLAVAAERQNLPVTAYELPEHLGRLGLLAGLDPTELAEVVAETMHNLNRTALGADLRGLHTDLVTAVADRLTGQVTCARLVAGLQVLRRVYDPASGDVLAPDELRALNSYVDTVGNTEQVRNELLSLEGELRALARSEADGGAAGDGFAATWPVRGLTVLATRARTGRHRRFLEHLVFHRTLQEIGNRRHAGESVLVVAGADQIGLDALEAMARQARRTGVLLVFLLQHLRDDLRKMLGSAGSVSLLMQLGNGEEAAAAAEFIGRGFKFELSQLTLQIGETLTRGTAATDGGSFGTSRSRGYSVGSTSSHGWSGDQSSSSFGTTSSRTSSTTTTREQNWSNTVNESSADSHNKGWSASRVYEFTAEPTELQSLAPTAFILVESGPQGRRVVGVDCSPDTVLRDRVADRPRLG